MGKPETPYDRFIFNFGASVVAWKLTLSKDFETVHTSFEFGYSSSVFSLLKATNVGSFFIYLSE